MSRTQLTIALAGNPNAGKTSLFNELTGARQHVGNYPGVTVEKKEGLIRRGDQDIKIVDLPGTYSLTAYSLEELVARNYVIGQRPDVVVDVVDAANLERNLYLAVQLMELGAPLVICLNMMDVAEKRGIKVDPAKLEELLGVPVVPTVARTGKGVDQLVARAVELGASRPRWRPLDISYGADVDEGLGKLRNILEGDEKRDGLLSSGWLGLKLLEGDSEVLDGVKQDQELSRKILPVVERTAAHIRATLDDDPESIIADYRYGYITGITREAVTMEREVRMNFSDRIDKVLTNRLVGPLFLVLVLYAIYNLVFWASEGPVVWFESFFGWMGAAVWQLLPEGPLRSLIVSGVINGVGGVLGFVPLIMFMFLSIAIMEDTGYMARVAYLMDRVLRAFGLHGNSVISLVVSGGISGGCAVPGVMAARTLKDPQARLATIMVVPFMNCGAKLPVYGLLIAAFFAHRQAEMLFILTVISWSLALLAAKLLRVTLLKGEQAPFVMELPPYRTPTIKGILIHGWERTWQYIKKAGTVILAISVLMWALMSFPGLPPQEKAQWDARIEAAVGDEAKSELQAGKAEAALAATAAGSMGRALSYVTAPLGFDWRTNVALVGGFAAKEVIISTLGTSYSLGEVDPEETVGLSQRLAGEPGWNPLTAFSLMIFVMVYAPCFVTVAVIRKETGSWGWAGFSILYNTVIAYVLSLLIYQGGQALGLG